MSAKAILAWCDEIERREMDVSEGRMTVNEAAERFIPGLVKREFYSTSDGAGWVREEWDLTVPGCPMLVVDHTKWGSGESVIDMRATKLVRTVRYDRRAD